MTKETGWKEDFWKVKSCKDMPLFYNKTYDGICEREGTECKECILLSKKKNKK